MQVLIFKTNIKYKKNINSVKHHINVHPEIKKWNVDLKDADKILRIETMNLHPDKVIQLVNNAGYDCEELED